MKELDCIDSSIILEIIFENEEKCKQYLNTIGYKSKNQGLLTIPILGETFANLLLKSSQTIEDPIKRKIFIQSAVDFLDDIILDLLLRGRLIISKLEKSDYQFVSKIQELDYKITGDDAFHLSSAINKQCRRFVTIDKDLLHDTFRAHVREEFGLTITAPM